MYILHYLREAIKKKIRSNLGHCPNREGGWLRIKLIFQSVYEIFWKIPKVCKTLWNIKINNLLFFILNREWCNPPNWTMHLFRAPGSGMIFRIECSQATQNLVSWKLRNMHRFIEGLVYPQLTMFLSFFQKPIITEILHASLIIKNIKIPHQK